MKRIRMIHLLLAVFLCTLLAVGGTSPSLYAGGKGKVKSAKKAKDKGKQKGKGEKWIPPGLSKKEKGEWAGGTPPGWKKGKKTGWGDSNVPPGFNEWNRAKQEKWKEDLKAAKKKAKNWIRHT